MRERNLLYLFLSLNVALAGAFVVYLFLSTGNQPKVVATSFPTAGDRTNAVSPTTSADPKNSAPRTNAPVAPARPVNNLQASNAAASNPPPAQPVFTPKKFTWQDVETPAYQTYIKSLRAIGCPDDKIRQIILADINEMFTRKRQKEAVALDVQWWRTGPQLMLGNTLQEKGEQLEEERLALIDKFLGPEAAKAEKSEPLQWHVQLTGAVLGGLPPKVHNAVQEICQRSIERYQEYQVSRLNDNQPINPVEVARLRDQTRSELRQVLTAEQLEEFLLRYSHVAEDLRMELIGMDPTPEEFRKIFRAIDPLDHQMQLEFGSLQAMSPRQRERYDRQREAAIEEVLGPERYQVYLLTKDPLYRQAQMTARQYGAPAKAILPIYQMTKANETKRQQILNDASLTPQEKSDAINKVNQDQQRTLQQIVVEANAQR